LVRYENAKVSTALEKWSVKKQKQKNQRQEKLSKNDTPKIATPGMEDYLRLPLDMPSFTIVTLVIGYF
jgi:hypothetical protein